MPKSRAVVWESEVESFTPESSLRLQEMSNVMWSMANTPKRRRFLAAYLGSGGVRGAAKRLKTTKREVSAVMDPLLGEIAAELRKLGYNVPKEVG